MASARPPAARAGSGTSGAQVTGVFRSRFLFMLLAGLFWLACFEGAAGLVNVLGYKFFPADQYLGTTLVRSNEWNGPLKIPTSLQNQSVATPAAPVTCSYSGLGRTYGDAYFGEFVNSATAPLPGKHPTTFFEEATGKTVASATYTIDQHGFRFVPQHGLSQRNRYAVFLGCSFTYGEGINDEETLPAQFAQVSPEYHAYNFAFHGYSAASLLARTRGEKIENIVKEKEGVIIYTFIEDHVRRTIGSMRLTQEYWGQNLPFFYEASNGSVQQAGNFLSGRPWRQWFLKVLSHSQILKLFNVDLPFRYTEGDWRLFAKVVAALRDEYLQRLPNGRFYFAFFPVASNYFVNRLGPHLDHYKIPYLVYRSEDLDHAAQAPLKIPIDCHPALETNRILARQLAIDLPKESSKNIP